MKVFNNDIWSVKLPEKWQLERYNNLYTFYHPDSVGVLQISELTKETVVTENDLKEFACEHIDAGVVIKFIETKAGVAMTLNFVLSGEFWQYWYFGIGNSALLVTYNCDEEDREIELTIIKDIVSSIEKTNKLF